ncbi:(2Fe-2S)-binding protein [Dactylosporangium sp. NPDC048998]|uniref:(2Fe-2S)-binding protein n=1 Tax=Dactylosporangium sp. NPDC048998 TaxID=3363976 RepID=UPI0037229E43
MNPYFVWEDPEAGAGWRPFAELLDPGVVAERVAVSRQALVAMFGLAEDAVPERVVASVLFLGYASRLLSPLLAESLEGTIRGVTPADLWWRPVPGGPLPIAARAVEARPAADLFDVAVLGLVAPLLEVFRARFRLSPQVLWGNVASALGGAAGQLPKGAWPAVADLLGRPPLAGMAIVGQGAGGQGSLRRRNCCLYYRIPGGGTCGDCVLRPA